MNDLALEAGFYLYTSLYTSLFHPNELVAKYKTFNGSESTYLVHVMPGDMVLQVQTMLHTLVHRIKYALYAYLGLLRIFVWYVTYAEDGSLLRMTSYSRDFPAVARHIRRRLRSSASARLDIPRARQTTVGDRAFCIAGPRVWNSLSSSLLVFRRLLKCELFHRCYDLC